MAVERPLNEFVHEKWTMQHSAAILITVFPQIVLLLPQAMRGV